MSVQKTESHNPGNSLDEKERLPTLETLRSLDGLVQKKEENCEDPTNGTLDEHWRLLMKTLARETVVQPIQSQNKIMVNQLPSTPVQQQACLPDSREGRHGSPESAASKCPTYTTTDCKTRKKRKTRHDNWFSKRHHADDKTSTKTELKGRRKQTQKPTRFLGEVQSSQSLKVNSKHRKQHLQQHRDSRPMFMPGDQKKSAVSSGTIKKIGRIPGQPPVTGDYRSTMKDGRRKQTQKPSRFWGEVQSSQSLKVNSRHRKQHLQQLRDSRPMFMPGDQKKSAVSSGTIKKIGRIPGQPPVTGDYRSTMKDGFTYSLSFTDDVSAAHYKSSSQIPRHPGQTLKLKRLESITKASGEILNPKNTQSMSGYKTHKEDKPKDQFHQDGAYQTKKEPLVQIESMVKGRDAVRTTTSTRASAINPIPFLKARASHRSNSDNNHGASKDIDLKHLMPNQRLLSNVTKSGTVLTSTRMTETGQGRQHDKGRSSRKLSTHIHKKVLVVPLHRRSLPHHIPTRISGPSHKLSQTSAEPCQIARESETESRSIKTRDQTAGHGKPDPCRTLVSQNTPILIKENGLQHKLISHRAEETCSPHQHLTRQVVVQRLPSKIPYRMIKENCLLHQQNSQLEEETHSPHHHLIKQVLLHQLPNHHLKVMANDGLTCQMPCGQKKSCIHPVQSHKQSELHLVPNAREKFISNASSSTKMPKKKDNNISNCDKDHVGKFKKCKDKLSLIFHHHHHHHHGNLFRRFLHLDEKNGGKKHAEDKKPLHRKEHGQLHMLLAAFLRYILHPRKARAEHKQLDKAKMMATGRQVKKIHWWQKFYKRGGVRLASRKKPHLRISMGANSGRAKVAAKH